MNHHSGLLNGRRFAVLALALIMALVLTSTIAANGADAKRHKKARVTVKVQTKNQGNLLRALRLNLIVKATAPTTMKVRAFNGGKANRFDVRMVRFNRARTRRFPLSISQIGRRRQLNLDWQDPESGTDFDPEELRQRQSAEPRRRSDQP